MDSPKIHQLKIDYKSKFPAKASELRGYIQSLDDPDEPLNSVEQRLGEYLHKLVGSAGMYGYDDVAKLAKQAMLEAKKKKSGEDITGVLIKLRDLLER